MASFRQRGTRWNVQIIRKNNPRVSKTFSTKKAAKCWARKIERDIDLKGLQIIHYPTLQSIIERYIKEVSINKKGYEAEKYHLKSFQKFKFILKPINEVTPQDLVGYRKERLFKVSTTTYVREMNIIQHIFSVASKEWGYVMDNPCKLISKPKIFNKRERRLTDAEYNFLIKGNHTNQTLKQIIEIAYETGMRKSEILNVKKEHLDNQTLLIPETKNGHQRKIPISYKAWTIFNEVTLPFPASSNAIRIAWDRLKKKGNIKDLHFHDLRHEAISRFFEKGLSIPEVALISGHKDVRMLFRYTHLKAEDILRKL